MAEIPMKDKFKKSISSALFMQIDKSCAYDQASQSCSDLCDQFAKDFGEYIGEQIKYGNIKPSFKGDIIYWKLTREDRLINQHELFDLFQKQR